MSWTIGDREEAIALCDFDKQGNDNQCSNCENGRVSAGAYMAIDCIVWCADTMYDEICHHHKRTKT